MEEMVTVRMADGTKKEMSYADLCHDLGIDPHIHFVDVNSNGCIDYTCGKRDEISLLWGRAENKGYSLSKHLTKKFY